MDEIDDFFDVQNRFRVPEKRKRPVREHDVDSDSDSDSETSSSDETIREVVVPRRPKVIEKPAKKKRNYISLSSDDEDENKEEETVAESPPAHTTLTPPPVIAQEVVRKAMELISDHNQTGKPRTRAQIIAAEDSPQNGTSDFEDDFDLAEYQSAMNNDIAKQAAALSKGPESFPTDCGSVESKMLIVLLGRRMAGEKVADDWEKPLGVRITSGIAFDKLREEFKKQKCCEEDVVFVYKGVRLRYGTPKTLSMKDQDTIDVFTEGGWKWYEENRSQNQGKQKTATSGSDDEEPAAPAVTQISLRLQGPPGKCKLKTATILKIARVYRQVCKIPPEKQMVFILDGEALEGTETVKDLGLEDDDLLDVQIENA